MSTHLESRALSAIICCAPADGDTSPEARKRARDLSARALRAWRAAGDRKRAKWFDDHIAFVGVPLTDQRVNGAQFSLKAFLRRYDSHKVTA